MKTEPYFFTTASESGNVFRHSGKLFSSDMRHSMKRRIATERRRTDI